MFFTTSRYVQSDYYFRLLFTSRTVLLFIIVVFNIHWGWPDMGRNVNVWTLLWILYFDFLL